MIRLKISFTVAFLLGTIALQSGVYAQNIRLYEVDRQTAAKSTLNAYELDRTYITFHPETTQKQNLMTGMELVLPAGGQELELQITRTESYLEGTHSITAANNETGDMLIITFENDQATGKLHAKSLGSLFHFNGDPETNLTYISQINYPELDILACAVHGHNHVENSSLMGKTYNPPNMLSMAETMHDSVTIDVMIPYTGKAESWANSSTHGSINSVIAQAMSLSQAALDNSGVYINLRLVHAYKTGYDDDDKEDVSAGEHLRRLTASPDFNPYGEEYDGFFNEVHDLRDQYGADLVALFASEPNTGGLAWMLNNPGGDPNTGFSLNRIQQLTFSYTLIHEIGHNMGNMHARGQDSQGAGATGGLFDYSTGYRWFSGNDGFVTVMAYDDGDFNNADYAPMFSNPDSLFAGNPAGTYDSASGGPSDNALSMRQTKRVIAFYRSTVMDAPVISSSEQSVNVSMDREDQLNVPLTISNSGDSDLMWHIDFKPGVSFQQAKAAPASYETESLPPSVLPREKNPTASYSVFTTEEVNSKTVFSTSFGSDEGFASGSYSALNGWRTFSTNYEFEILNSNPSAGSHHMRLSHDETYEHVMWLRSPYFGPQSFGSYEFEADLNINPGTGETKERFDLYLYDGSTGLISAGTVFNSDGLIYAFNVNQNGETTFQNTGTSFGINEYKTVKIVFNPEDEVIEYYYDNQLITGNQYTPDGKKADFFRILNYNQQESSFIDIDNILISRPHNPFRFLDIDRFGGTVASGEQQDVNLTFKTYDVDAGQYEMDLVISSNDPDRVTKTIPLTLNVSSTLTSAKNPEKPARIALAQNYPNPFNPATDISYTLPASSDVTLAVYDMLGRRISVLVSEEVAAGSHTVRFDASGMASGVYIYRLETPGQVLTNKMVLIK